MGILLSAIIFSFTKEKTDDILQDHCCLDFKEALDKLDKIGIIFDCEKFNLVNSAGMKHGIWLEENQSYISLSNYKSGMKDGIEVVFNQSALPARLVYLLEYTNDSIRSIISFDTKTGLPTGISQFIRENNNPIIHPETTDSDYTLPFLFYSKYYDRNSGHIESEGHELLGDDWEIDNWMIGEWKFYDEEGAIEIRDYGL